MLHDLRLGVEFFAWVAEVDRRLARQVAAGGCQWCGGPLHQGNYERKPRGGTVGLVGGEPWVRQSLCCGREGCRRREQPPSLMCLGRRVYVEAVVLVASVMALVVGGCGPASGVTGVPARTLTRWGSWWREQYPSSRAWVMASARLAPPPAVEGLPRSLYERLDEELARGGSARSPGDVCVLAARLLVSCSTSSRADASRWLRGMAMSLSCPAVTQKMV